MVNRTTTLDSRPTQEEALAAWDETEWTIVCLRMQTLLAAGSLDNAIGALKSFAMRALPQMASLDTFVFDIFHGKLASLLVNEGFNNLRSLHLSTDEELLRIKGLGHGHLSYVRGVLSDVVAGNRLAIDILEHVKGDDE